MLSSLLIYQQLSYRKYLIGFLLKKTVGRPVLAASAIVDYWLNENYLSDLAQYRDEKQ